MRSVTPNKKAALAGASKPLVRKGMLALIERRGEMRNWIGVRISTHHSQPDEYLIQLIE